MASSVNDNSSSIRVQLFAGAAAAAGTRFVDLQLPENGSMAAPPEPFRVADVRRLLVQQHPDLAGLAERSRFAVGTEFVDDQMPLPQDAAIAMIPPVSGG